MSATRQNLLAEIAEVEAMLTATPPAQAILAHSMKTRLHELQTKLAELPAETTKRAEVELTFRGKPVHRSEGVNADFAGKALEQYSKAISLISANQRATLRSKGPIPGRSQPSLFVCNRAIGSFGFVLRELIDAEEEAEESASFIDGQIRSSVTYQATEQMAAILQASQASDDDLAEIASDMDRRTLHAIRDFLTTVADADACAQHRLAGQPLVRFADVGSVRGAAERLSDENIEEAEITITGTLDGFLPGRGMFELLSEGEEGRITGKVDPSLDEQAIAELKQAIDSRIEATLHVTKVGTAKTVRRYRLLSWKKTALGQQGKLDLGAGE